MQQLLHRISHHLPRKQIFHTVTQSKSVDSHSSQNETKILILERFNLFSIANGPGLVLHRFVHSDPDRGYHDHPWKVGMSLILSGSYSEIKIKHSNREMSEKVFGPGSFNFFSGKDYHRVLLFPNMDNVKNKVEDEYEVWTLFFHWKRVKHWGFLQRDETTEDGWKFDQYSKTIEDLDGAWWRRVENK